MLAADDRKAEILPAEVQGWLLSPKAEAYTAEDLYKYIDGASELYISYGFRKLLACRYERAGWPEITVDLFDMGIAENAFGIFAHSQEDPGCGIGRDCEYLDGLLRFWQGTHYVSLLCSPETPESRTAVMALGRRIAQGLPSAGERPALLSLLPESGLIDPSIRYFRHHAWQNAYVFISPENVLGIGPENEAVLVRYEQRGVHPVVLLVRYPDDASARGAFAAFRRLFQLPADGGAIQLPDKKCLAAGMLDKRMIAAVWHAGGADRALQLLAAVRGKAEALKK